MKTYIVARIHNNSLGSVISVSDESEGIAEIKKLAEGQLERPLLETEIDEIESKYEIYNDDDADNVWSISLGIVE